MKNLEIAQYAKNKFTGKYRTSDNVRQKIEFCPIKAVSQRTHLSGVKLELFL